MATSVASRLGTPAFVSYGGMTKQTDISAACRLPSALLLSASTTPRRHSKLSSQLATPFVGRPVLGLAGSKANPCGGVKRTTLTPCASSKSSNPPHPEEDIIGSLVGYLGLGEKEARALTGAMLDGVGKVVEREGGNSEAQKFSSAFPDLTDWKATARDILTGDSHGSSHGRSGGGLGDVLGDVLGGGHEDSKKKSGGGILEDIFGGGGDKHSRSSSGGGLGGKLGDILGDVLKSDGGEKGGHNDRYEEPRNYDRYDTKYDKDEKSWDKRYDSGYDKKYDRYEEDDRSKSSSSGGGLLSGGLASSVGHLLLKSFLGIGELKLAVNLIKRLGVDPLQTVAVAYLLIKFVRGRVGPDIFGMILKHIPLFRLVLDDRNPIIKLALGTLKKVVLP